jgi:hypothetical protein
MVGFGIAAMPYTNMKTALGVRTMASRYRKTLVLCHTCHHEIHRDRTAGDVKARRQRTGFLESRVR